MTAFRPPHHSMKPPFIPIISCVLLGITAAFAAEAPPAETPARPDAPRQNNRARPMPKAEWQDPDQGAPNGAQYHTFPSKVLGRDVSCLVSLPPGYDQG